MTIAPDSHYAQLMGKIKESYKDHIKVVIDTNYEDVVLIYPIERVKTLLSEHVIKKAFTPSEDKKQQQITLMMKTALKGVLTLYGDTLLTMLYGANHIKPPTKCPDIIAWYTTLIIERLLELIQEEVFLIESTSTDEHGYTFREHVNVVTQIDRLSPKPLQESTEK